MKSIWTVLPTAIVQLAPRVIVKVRVGVYVTSPAALAFSRHGPELSITWTAVGRAVKVLLEVTVMVLAVVRAAVAVKKSSSLSAERAVVAVGEIVTLLTEPVREPIV